jgi:hypothetical protein
VQSPHVDLEGITQFINEKGLARVELRQEDIKTLLDTLIHDGRSGTTPCAGGWMGQS